MKVFRYGMAIIIFSLVFLCLYEFYLLQIAQDKTEKIRESFLQTHSVALGEISSEWLDMLFKVEDPNFYNHDGIDYQTPGAGLTSITQSLTKFMYFEKFRPGFAKIEQTLIAKFVLDKNFTKDEQLSIFFNYAYLGSKDGNSVIGFPKAARVYYNSELTHLTDDQYLSLIAMLVAPNSLNVEKHPKENAERVEKILNVLNGSYKPKSLTDIYYDKKDV